MLHNPIPEQVLEDDDISKVLFRDGHVLMFVPFDWRNPLYALRNVQLYCMDILVAQFNCQLDRRHFDRRGRLAGQHSLAFLAPNYDAAILARYWVAAKEFVTREYYAQPHRMRTADPDTDICFSYNLVWTGIRDLRILLRSIGEKEGIKK